MGHSLIEVEGENSLSLFGQLLECVADNRGGLDVLDALAGTGLATGDQVPDRRPLIATGMCRSGISTLGAPNPSDTVQSDRRLIVLDAPVMTDRWRSNASTTLDALLDIGSAAGFTELFR